MECLSCYGAESHVSSCCNSCEDVKKAYRDKGWQFVPYRIKQCENDYNNINMESKYNNREEIEKLLDTKEGCRLEGFITVNKIAGSFHIGKFQYQNDAF